MCSSHISYVLPCLSVLPHKPYPGPFPLLVPIEGYVACPSPLAALYQELCRYHSPLGVLWQWRPPQDAAPPPRALSAVGFLRVVMIPMFVPSRMALSLLPPEVLGGQRPFWGRQERSVCLQRRDGRPGLWDKAPHGERRRLEQRHPGE